MERMVVAVERMVALPMVVECMVVLAAEGQHTECQAHLLPEDPASLD